jgi:hypothetical protein
MYRYVILCNVETGKRNYGMKIKVLIAYETV